MRIALFLLLVPFISTLTLAQTVEPKIITEKNGKVINYRMEGSLAATQAVQCVSLDSVNNSFTPPDLYVGVNKCLAEGNYFRAAELFSLAGVYSRFDAERVSDKSATQGRTVLIMNTSASWTPEQKKKIGETLGHISKSPDTLGKMCNAIQKVGMPNYYPSYMILHGMKAFMGNPHDGALLKNFDAPATWANLMNVYLHCPT